MERLGTGIGWRPEIAEAVEAMPGVDWVETVAENLCPGHLPDSLVRLRERGVTVVPHGVGLGLGGAERPDEERLAALAERAQCLGAPLVTEHIAFVRAGGVRTASTPLEAGHLLPVPRTRDALAVLCENIRIAQANLPVPLAVENIAALISWPNEELTEGQFLHELVERTGVRLLIDVANLHTNHVNRGEDPARVLDTLPLEALAYVHVAGGFERAGVWHDSHAHPVPRAVLDILAELASRTSPPGVLLERDENFPAPDELAGELAVIRRTVREAGQGREAAAEGALTASEGAAGHERAGAPEGTGAHERSAGHARSAASEEPARPEETARREERAPHKEPASPEKPPAPEEAAASEEPASSGEPALAAVPAPAPPPVPEETRQRLALAQTALLSALVAGTPVPEGFDRVRLAVQSRALAAKRASVVAKVAPELPLILGESAYREAFSAHAQRQPMSGGYRRDALDFAERLLLAGQPADASVRAELRAWWLERSGSAPRSARPLARLRHLGHSARRVLARR